MRLCIGSLHHRRLRGHSHGRFVNRLRIGLCCQRITRLRSSIGQRRRRHLEGERHIVGSYTRPVVAELIVHRALHFERFVAVAFDFLTESGLTAKGADHALEHLVHLLVGLGFHDAAHTLVAGVVLEGELRRYGAVGVRLLRIEMPSGLQRQLELQLDLVGRQLLHIEFPMGRIDLRNSSHHLQHAEGKDQCFECFLHINHYFTIRLSFLIKHAKIHFFSHTQKKSDNGGQFYFFM